MSAATIFAASRKSAVRSAPAVASVSHSYLIALGILMASGTVVLFEPAPYDIFLMLMFAAGLMRNKMAFRKNAHTPVLVLLAGFALANIFSFSQPIDTMRGIWYLTVTLYMLLSMVFVMGVTSQLGLPAVRAMAIGYGAGGVVSVLLGAAAYFGFVPWREALLLYGRPKGLFKDPNVFGPYLVPMVIYALASIRIPPRTRMMATVRRITAAPKQSALLRNTICIAVILIGVWGVLISFSRASWINCALTIPIFFALALVGERSAAQRYGTWMKVALLAGLLVLGAMVVLATPAITDMLDQRVGANGLNSYDSERFEAHRVAFDTAIDHPLGIGPGQWERFYSISTHSLYYRALSENGFLGLFTLGCLLALSVFRALWLATSSEEREWRMLYCVLSACLLGLLVNSGVIDTLHWRHTWVLLGLIWTSSPTPKGSGSRQQKFFDLPHSQSLALERIR